MRLWSGPVSMCSFFAGSFKSSITAKKSFLDSRPFNKPVFPVSKIGNALYTSDNFFFYSLSKHCQLSNVAQLWQMYNTLVHDVSYTRHVHERRRCTIQKRDVHDRDQPVRYRPWLNRISYKHRNNASYANRGNLKVEEMLCLALLVEENAN